MLGSPAPAPPPEGARLFAHAQAGETARAAALLAGGAGLAGEMAFRHPTTGRTALHIAALKGNAELVQLLLDHGAPARGAPDGTGELPMHLAAWKGHAAVVRALLGSMDPETAQAVVGTKDCKGDT